MRRYQVGENQWVLIVTGGNGARPTQMFIGPAGHEVVLYGRFYTETAAIAEACRRFAWNACEWALLHHQLVVNITWPDERLWHITCGPYQATATDWYSMKAAVEAWAALENTIPRAPRARRELAPEIEKFRRTQEAISIKTHAKERELRDGLSHAKGAHGRNRAYIFPITLSPPEAVQ